MSDIAVIEIYGFKKRPKTAIDAHLRNSLVLERELPADLLLTENEFIRASKKTYKAFILSYATFYAPFQLIKLVLKNSPNAKRFMLANEYNNGAASVGGYMPFHLIHNFDETFTAKSVLSSHFVNLNLLLARSPNVEIKKYYDCVYYGTFRPDRAKYFAEYLQQDVYLSSSSRNFKKFKHIGCNPRFIQKLDWMERKETLNRFKYSLYIEDEYTHKVFNFMANRWYEAGFCNCVCLFDINCARSLERAQIVSNMSEAEPYIVSNRNELRKRIEAMNRGNWIDHLKIQRQWRRNELEDKKKVIDKIRELVNS